MKKYSKALFFFSFFCFCVLLSKCSGKNKSKKEACVKYFVNTYEECRSRFIEIAKELVSQHDKVEIGKIKVPCKNDTDLTIDFLYIPAQLKPEGLFIMSSGVHGVEGFAGSAIQQMFMKEILTPYIDLNHTGVLLIHSINPWGHKYFRRVTENNIDFNRNCSIDDTIFSLENENYNNAYPKFNEFLNPRNPCTCSFSQKIKFILETRRLIKKHNIRKLRRAILQGQYEFVKGIFFGGRDFEPQKKELEDLITRCIKDYKKIKLIDLHTGYGVKNKLHFFRVEYDENAKLDSLIDRVYKNYKIDGCSKQDMAEEDEFYTVTGSWAEFVIKLARDIPCIAMGFEFGTLNSQKKMGTIKSLRNMVYENQGFWNGYACEDHERKVNDSFIQMFYPKSLKWRKAVMRQVKECMPVILKRFQDL